jgi:NAD(P)H-quinone oxidoreductase subunit 5
MLFALSLASLFWRAGPELAVGSVLHVDGLTQIMALVITFVSGIVHSFSRRYMAGQQHRSRFYGRLFGLTLIVLLLTAANHVVLFVGAWTAMGWVLADLIGHIRGWPQAQAASRYARRSFLGGSAVLTLAVTGLALQTGAWTVTGIGAQADALSLPVLAGLSGLLLLAAMVQSALVPFHRWLLSSMTAPTPVSAFMHAGLVNAGGLLLARFAPVVAADATVLLGVVVVGGISALLGQAWMLVQTDVKRQLGCSTVAQMGFMVLQGGLGFIPAAITHLMLHGFYKAYLFLAAGSGVGTTRPNPTSATGPSLGHGVVALGSAVAGGALFAVLTGKSLMALDSGTVLVLFVVLAVLHATQAALRRTTLSPVARLGATPLLLVAALAVYAGVYNGVTILLADLPMAVVPTDLTPVHGGLVAVFVLAYVAVERGWHRSSARLYVWLHTTSQPLSTTLLTRRDQYHAY